MQVCVLWRLTKLNSSEHRQDLAEWSLIMCMVKIPQRTGWVVAVIVQFSPHRQRENSPTVVWLPGSYPRPSFSTLALLTFGAMWFCVYECVCVCVCVRVRGQGRQHHVYCSITNLYTTDASRTFLNLDNKKCLQTLPDIFQLCGGSGGGDKILPFHPNLKSGH